MNELPISRCAAAIGISAAKTIKSVEVICIVQNESAIAIRQTFASL
jgi:hypothetical protein